MDLIDFGAWPADTLLAYTTILTLSFIVLVLVVVFREFSAWRSGGAPSVGIAGGSGRFGFQKSQGERVRMKVLQIRALSADVKSFRLLPLDSYVDYESGQFLTFHTGKDCDVPRCYSLNTAPTLPGVYEVSVKLLEGGLGSTWMHEEVAVGDVLEVTNPSGRFVLQDNSQTVILVAGGIGITPILSMLHYLVETASERSVFLFYGARTRADLVFEDEILELVARAPNVRFIPILSDADEDWTGDSGFLSAEIMIRQGIEFSRASVYTCGPPPLMDSAKAIAVAEGMPSSRFYNEVFSSPAATEIEPRQATISVDGLTLAYDGKQTLLDFLEEHDIVVPCSCRAGVCGTCEVTVVNGDIDSLPSEYLTEADQAAGKCLTCISFPRADLEIEI